MRDATQAVAPANGFDGGLDGRPRARPCGRGPALAARTTDNRTEEPQ